MVDRDYGDGTAPGHRGTDPSKRQSVLKQALDRFMGDKIGRRIAVFDACAAIRTAELSVVRQRRGRIGELRDSMIAGIVIAAGAALATRNTRHFDDLPITVVNPWST